jgi:uncharacterized protein
MEAFGYLGALLMGLVLGIIGGGGSILTVPILVYVFGVEPVLATAYSLFIVGLTSAAGSVTHFRLGNVHYKAALVFGLPSIAAVYLTRKILVPMIPNVVATIGQYQLTKPVALLLLFAVVMVLAAFSMIRKQKNTKTASSQAVQFNFPLIFLEGAVVGVLTGLVGAGGGFLIIPALVLFAKLPMKQAVGTSLVIIAAKSLIGFTGDAQGSLPIDWTFLGVFSLISIVGILVGAHYAQRISNEKLKPAFGWFVLVMGVWIILKEIVF